MPLFMLLLMKCRNYNTRNKNFRTLEMRQPGTDEKELHTKTYLSGIFPLIAPRYESNSRFYFVHAKDKILDKPDQTKTTHSRL